MSVPGGSHPPGPAPGGHGGGEHASVATYVKVAVILTIVTALEFAVLYIRALTPILTPLLLVLSAGKFALVVLFFMHLRYDPRPLATLFLGPLVIAAGLGVALMTLYGAFLIFGR
ncbi:MAG TPA: cytochrome C oxidase subunit IV family protein [Candidatus Tectomicrobia bacterium]|nr:cytochrome C oxidase subunit IV family protein [Candidatus Tectomicrobia bacterium]